MLEEDTLIKKRKCYLPLDNYNQPNGNINTIYLTRNEYLKLKELVREIDPSVFFLIVDAYESSVKKNCKNL